MAGTRKFTVADKYRKNNLSHIDSPIKAEVHDLDVIKVYDNIHSPDAFAKKVFRNNEHCTKIVFTDLSTQTVWTVNR